MAVCPACRADNRASAAFCSSCGKKLPARDEASVAPTQPSQTIACPGCGTSNSHDHTFCRECGQRLTRAEKPAAEPAPEQPTSLPPTRLAQGTVCPKCGTFNAEGHAFCRECGWGLAAGEKPVPSSTSETDTAAARAASLPPTRLAQGTVCPNCGTFNSEANIFCRECGTGLGPPGAEETARAGATTASPARSVACPRCGSPNAAGQKLCGECGANMLSATEKRTRRLVARAREEEETSEEEARLVMTRPDGKTESYNIEEEVTIGREEGEIRVPDDDFLSATHARISREGDRFILRDLDSTNGTFVRLRAETLLRPGDYIMIGDRVFRFDM